MGRGRRGVARGWRRALESCESGFSRLAGRFRRGVDVCRRFVVASCAISDLGWNLWWWSRARSSSRSAAGCTASCAPLASSRCTSTSSTNLARRASGSTRTTSGGATIPRCLRASRRSTASTSSRSAPRRRRCTRRTIRRARAHRTCRASSATSSACPKGRPRGSAGCSASTRNSRSGTASASRCGARRGSRCAPWPFYTTTTAHRAASGTRSACSAPLCRWRCRRRRRGARSTRWNARRADAAESGRTRAARPHLRAQRAPHSLCAGHL